MQVLDNRLNLFIYFKLNIVTKYTRDYKDAKAENFLFTDFNAGLVNEYY